MNQSKPRFFLSCLLSRASASSISSDTFIVGERRTFPRRTRSILEIRRIYEYASSRAFLQLRSSTVQQRCRLFAPFSTGVESLPGEPPSLSFFGDAVTRTRGIPAVPRIHVRVINSGLLALCRLHFPFSPLRFDFSHVSTFSNIPNCTDSIWGPSEASSTSPSFPVSSLPFAHPLQFLRNLASIDREYRNRHFSNSTFLSSKGRIDDTAVCQTFVASGIRARARVCNTYLLRLSYYTRWSVDSCPNDRISRRTMVGIDAEKRSFPSALLQWSRSVIEEGATK